MATTHLQENLDDYVKSKVCARESSSPSGLGKLGRSSHPQKTWSLERLKQCGISVPIDSSEDGEINIISLGDYEVDASKDEASDYDADPFEDMD